MTPKKPPPSLSSFEKTIKLDLVRPGKESSTAMETDGPSVFKSKLNSKRKKKKLQLQRPGMRQADQFDDIPDMPPDRTKPFIMLLVLGIVGWAIYYYVTRN
ncbi:MAG: hypothetical protein WCG27_06225 [Pseudomonadota bacterium]